MAVTRFTLFVPLALLSGSATAFRQKAEEDGDPCACRNWKHAYASGAAKCGQTNEYYHNTHVHSLTPSQLEEADQFFELQFCTGFFEAMNDNVCVNMDIEKAPGVSGQWCYVDAACANLTGGEKVNDRVSWKMCADGQDRMLKNMSPPELLSFAEANGLELGLTNKMAYPVAPYRWRYISAFWDADLNYITSVPESFGMELAELKEWLRPRWGKRHREMSENMTRDLQAIFDSGMPVTFESGKDRHPPHIIVQGKSVHVVLPSLRPTMICVSGCQK